jgi:hypothetical protein
MLSSFPRYLLCSNNCRVQVKGTYICIYLGLKILQSIFSILIIYILNGINICYINCKMFKHCGFHFISGNELSRVCDV